MHEQTFILDGQTLAIEPGDTILSVARRHGIEIPTLCYDPRLSPAGACRTCLVEVQGQRRLLPACAHPAQAGAVIHTSSARVRRHRQALASLYLTDHPSPRSANEQATCETGAPCQLCALASDTGADMTWGRMTPERAERPVAENVYVTFRADRCIACSRCTRYCAEVEGVSAIWLSGRGAHTTISTPDARSLLDTTCELCGGCIDVCPTGAMTETLPLLAHAKPERELTKVRTTCNYCGVGCQMDLCIDTRARAGQGQVVKITSPPPGTVPNDGNLCVKGRFAYQFVHHADRLTHPLVRGDDGELHEATWDDAITCAARGLLGVKERHGADALAFVSSARTTVEENYLVQKMARAVFGTHNVHQCAAT